MPYYHFSRIGFNLYEFIRYKYPEYAKASPHCKRMIDVINIAFPEKVMLVEAASKLKITPRWLQSECIKTFGITYSTLYRLIKAHAGISLIIKNNYSWRQIAELLKYSAEANLTRDFKKVFGLTPTEIKEYLYQTNIDINNLSFIDLKKI